jgi:hypothetical protein
MVYGGGQRRLPNQILRRTYKGMSVILLFLAAELFLAAAVEKRLKARQQLVQKWKQGDLSMNELLYLKTRPWFQKLYPPAKLNHFISLSKKCN